MRLFIVLLTAVVWAGLTACSAPAEETHIGEPPAEQQIGHARQGGMQTIELPDQKPKKTAQRYKAPVFGAPTWPFIEEGQTFALSWGEGPQQVPVFAEPDLNAELVGQVQMTSGQTIEWQHSWVSVYAPRVFVAKVPATIDGAQYAPGNRDLDQAPIAVELAPGHELQVLTYAGSATCYMRAGEVTFIGECPTPAEFQGDFRGRFRAEQYQPAERLWWVYISTPEVAGWIPVDDKVVVDLVEM